MRYLWWTLAVLFLCAAVVAALFYTGVLKFNNPSRNTYPVRGVDVSSYQGTIDWEVLASQNIQFAFIKATEGSGFVDPCFVNNLAGASETSLFIGAYHFFSFESSGKTQAENFIAAVPRKQGMLPPVVDVELYGDFQKQPPDAEAVRTELEIMLTALEEHYGVHPLLYVTEKSFELYIHGALESYDIWLRNILREPDQYFRFWQYTSRERLDGYSGREPYIDMNVFNGSQDEFQAYVDGLSPAQKEKPA